MDGQDIYSYALLSEQGYNSLLHQAENPAQLYASKLAEILAIAKQHLNQQVIVEGTNYFRQRYTYRHNLIILHQAGDKCYYDHYAANSLVNIAAPKVFVSAAQCIEWVKTGLEAQST